MNEQELVATIDRARLNLNQPETLEELLRALPNTLPNSKLHFDTHDLIAKSYYQKKEFDQALFYFKAAYESASAMNDHPLIAKALTNLGNVAIQKGKILEAKEFHEKALEIKNAIGDQIPIASSLINLSVIAADCDEDIVALSYLDRALKIYEAENRLLEYTKCLFNIGVIYQKNENSDIALGYFIDALSNITFDQDPVFFIHININIGNAYMTLKNYISSEKHLKKSLDLSKKIEYTLGEANSLAMLGQMYLTEEKLELSKQFCLSCLNLDSNTGHESIHEAYSSAFLDLGIIASKKLDYDESLTYLHQSLKICEDHEQVKTKRAVLEWLVKIYEILKNYNSAYVYQSELMNMKDQFHSKKFENKLQEIKYVAEKERVEKESAWHEQKNQELEKEKKRADDLLKNILPDEVAEELKNTGGSKTVYHEDVTVMFTDFHEFSHISRSMSPQDLVAELHQCFTMFDIIAGKHGIEKIKTVGDAYLAVCGLPTKNENHAIAIVQAAIEIRDFIRERKQQLGDRTFNIRIGIHSGPVVAGIVGVKKFAYDIWGDTVNIAARLEQNASVGSINISESTYEKVKDQIKCNLHSEVEAKNIGTIKIHVVE